MPLVSCIVTAMVAMLVVWVPPAEAGKYKRVATDRYVASAVGTMDTGPIEDSPVWCHEALDWGCAAVDAYPGLERYVTVEIHDASGMAGGYFYQCQGDSCPDDYVPFCQSIDKPFKLEAYTDFVGVMLFSGACPGGSASVVTAGNVEFTFLRTR